MSFLGMFIDAIKMNGSDDEEEYYLDEDYEDDKPARRGLFVKEEDDYAEIEDAPKPRFLSRSNPKVVPMKRGLEVSLIKPKSIEDAREICDFLLAGKAVVLNMEGMNMELAQRIIDFTCGATYSINGNLRKISNYIFIVTPESIELSGEFQDLLINGTQDMTGMNIRL